jgi:hypothetical protein
MNTKYKWKGPLSLSFGYSDGSYLNIEIKHSSGDQKVQENVEKCRLIIKNKNKDNDFSIGWSDISTNESDSIRFPSIMSTPEEVLEVLKSIENFSK